ncbi:hypothetical protein Y032_0018g3564 [Ancylostoma ceylanicum]|uniref:Uncharacterized protein n=1 Tax=Ancylostoma ceylanicum TaxID=53326 RepID=A0A016V530_9BILA|nr:hypothetical protein Y032_0018g3564 [Ancylostoma ceylanicum]
MTLRIKMVERRRELNSRLVQIEGEPGNQNSAESTCSAEENGGKAKGSFVHIYPQISGKKPKFLDSWIFPSIWQGWISILSI